MSGAEVAFEDRIVVGFNDWRVGCWLLGECFEGNLKQDLRWIEGVAGVG